MEFHFPTIFQPERKEESGGKKKRDRGWSKRGELTCFRGERNILGMIGLDGVHPSVLRPLAAYAPDPGRLPVSRGGPRRGPTRVHVVVLGVGRGPLRARHPSAQRRGPDPRLLDRKHAAPLLGQLGSRLRVTVIHRKVADDHGHRQGDGQHAGQGAEGAHEHAHVGLGHHVPVADRGHRDQGPPQAQRYALEVVLRIVLGTLRVIDQAREYHDAEDQEEYKKGQLFGGCAERLDQDLEAGRVACQLEQSHDAYYAQELEDVRVLEVGGEALEGQVEVEAQGSDHVDQVHRALDEHAPVRACGDPYQELEGEPGVAHALDVEKEVVSVRVRFVHRPGAPVPRVHRTVHDHRHPHVRMRLQAKRQDRDADEQDRDYADHLFPNINTNNLLLFTLLLPIERNRVKPCIYIYTYRLYFIIINSLDSPYYPTRLLESEKCCFKRVTDNFERKKERKTRRFVGET